MASQGGDNGRGHTSPRCFGSLPGPEIATSFDEPLPQTEGAAWEGANPHTPGDCDPSDEWPINELDDWPFDDNQSVDVAALSESHRARRTLVEHCTECPESRCHRDH